MYKPTTENLSQTAGADELLIASIGQIPAGSCTNKLASQNTYPSWGWWIVNGATTLYENWDINASRHIVKSHDVWRDRGLVL